VCIEEDILWGGKIHVHKLGYFFWRVRNISKRDLRHVCPSVCPHGTTRLPLDGISWNLIFEYFLKICRENPGFVKVGQG
jgi:hypothetical protein